MLILASNSPRRRELLALTGWTFAIRPAAIDETPLAGEDPGTYVTRLARSKARAGATLAPAGSLVLAADTIVADGPALLGKPGTPEQAAEMLRRLRGKTHQVCTAIAVVATASGHLLSERCCSQVPMRKYSPAELDAYVASGDPLDKAGAYGIQHAGFHPVEHFSGCFASVMGLPLCHLARLMQRMGYPPPADVPAACQANLKYRCAIFTAIQRGEETG